MADLTEQQLLSTDPEVLGLQRQRALANLLTGQAFNAPQGQVISGHYVKPSGLQQALPMINAAIGGLTNANLDTKQQELAAALRGKQQEALQNYITASQGTPAQMYPAQAGPMPNGGNIPQQVKTPATGPNYGEMFKAGTSQYASPQLQAAAYKLLEPITTKEGETITQRNLGAGGGMTPISIGQEKKSEAIRGYELAKSQGFPGSFLEYETRLKQAGANNMNINMGQHGFDNALKLRQDFKSEPIYKGFEEIKAAKNQIDQAATMASPAGDLAAATKIMKILDPGSVVRESELGMAMAATGLEDKVRNYANLVITGQKLTPAQRKDFVELSDKLYNVAGQQYNNKRNEYVGIAQANGLSVEAAAGKPVEFKQMNTNTFGISPNSLDAELKRRGL